MGYHKIETVFHSDGWYYDRLERVSWFEFMDTAYTNDNCTERFIYNLAQLDAKWLSDAEVHAINTLMDYGSCPQELVLSLIRNRQRLRCRDVGRRARLCKKRILNKF